MELLKTSIYASTLILAGLLVARFTLRRVATQGLWRLMVVAGLVVQLSSFLAPHPYIFLFAIFLIVPVLARSRQLLLPLYLFTYLIVPEITLPVTIGSLYLVNISAMSVLGIGAVGVIALRRDKRPLAVTSSSIFSVFVLLLLLIFVAARETSATNVLRASLDAVLGIAMPFFIAAVSLRDRDDFERLMLAFIMAILPLSVLAIYEALHAWPIYRIVWGHLGLPLTSGASVKVRGGLLRSPGPYLEPISFSFVITLGCLAAMLGRDLFRSQMHQLLSLIVLAGGLLAPQARGAWLGFAAGLIVADFSRRRFTALASKCAVILAAVALLFAGAQVSSKIANILGVSGEGAGSIDYRSNLLARGISEAQQHLLTGESYMNLQINLADLRQGEGIIDFVNTYLFFTLISGIGGLVLLTGMLFWWLYGAYQLRPRQSSRNARWHGGTFALAAMSAMIVELGFTSMGPRSWGVLMIVVALIGTGRRGIGRGSTKEACSATSLRREV